LFRNGSVVTLAHDKMHGEGEDALKLKGGVCGMIMQLRRKNPDGNHEYVVDFGAYGQWYCTHSELAGDDSEGWDQDEGETPRQRDEGIDMDRIFRNVREGELFRTIAEDTGQEEDHMPVDPVQADIDRRIKEIEKGMK